MQLVLTGKKRTTANIGFVFPEQNDSSIPILRTVFKRHKID